MLTRHRGVTLLGALIACNVAAWGWSACMFHGNPALLGTSLLAWMFGLRHAVDADHIAAIDNVVRKLAHDGRRAETAGLWFSLGHSTVVVIASLVVTASALGVEHWLDFARRIGSVAGTIVSATFLLAIAIANAFVLRSIWHKFAAVSRGRAVVHADAGLSGSSLLARLLRPLLHGVRRGWQMYPLGFLFGLGFDTATEIGVLGLAATQASRGIALWQVMVLPALFTAGMALVDTMDSVLMVHAYGWAFVHPLRKLWYNLTITAASIVVAVLIGAVEVLGLVGTGLSLHGPLWSAVGMLNDDLGFMGFAVIGVFILCWIASFTVYRWQGHHRV